MHEFKIIVGQKRNYKPNLRKLANALAKKMYDPEFLNAETVEKYAEEQRIDFLKIVYLEICVCNKLGNFRKSHMPEEIRADFGFVSHILDMLCLITPRELLYMFPPEKWYDGTKHEMKDYFTTMEAINKLDIDKSIAEEEPLIDLLWDYQNWEINKFMVAWTAAVSHMSQLNTGMDHPLDELFQKEGIPTYTYHEEEGYLYNRMTSETIKVEKPKRRIPKYFKSIKGGKEAIQ